MRRALLAASHSEWMRYRATHTPAIRRAVRRFMPGERLDDALAAAAALPPGIGAVLTELGENVTTAETAADVVQRYRQAIDSVRARGLACEISVKPTHLGLDIDAAMCGAHLHQLAEHAAAHGSFLWIDMEQSSHVDVTLDLYRATRSRHASVGVCLQAYLSRTAADLASLVPLGGGIRLVKGAYAEPAAITLPTKSAVDRHFLELAQRMLAPAARTAGLRPVFGTHDERLIRSLLAAIDHANARDVAEIHMLFGIRPAAQVRLARDGYRVRVLISYGDEWFPWYMRRLAERPANVLFAVKSMVWR